MRCHKCNFENIIKADYCQNCGEKFTKEEKEKAYSKTIYGKIEKLKKLKDIITLDIIKDNIIFKIVSLLVILGIGIYFLFTIGIDTKILNSNDYKIFYNKESNEYYLIVDDKLDEVSVSMYRPNRVKDMKINHYQLDDTLLDELEVKKDDDITLTTYKEDYYIIESNYTNKKNNKLKVYVYHKSDI